MAIDALGQRMKDQYEGRAQIHLPRRTYTIIRVDGRAFHTYTRGLQRPYDTDFMTAMDCTTVALCEEVQGAVCAFVQSDEISVLATDFGTEQTQAWFDGNVQKLASISASVATASFNTAMVHPRAVNRATFDARAFTIPDPTEVANYFIWRQKDAVRNSIQMLAHHYLSDRQCHGLNTDQLQDRLMVDHGVNWNNEPSRFKRGALILRAERGWQITEPWIFTQDQERLHDLIPRYG